MKPRVIGVWVIAVAIFQLALYTATAVGGKRAEWLFYFDPRWGIFFLQSMLLHSDAFPSVPLWASALLLFGTGKAVLRDPKWIAKYTWIELALSAPSLVFIVVVMLANAPANDGFSVRELFFGPFPVFVVCSAAPFCIARQYLSEEKLWRQQTERQAKLP